MFISHALSAANGFKKWSAAHPAAKYAPQPKKAALIAPAVPDTSSPHAESARSSRPITDFKHSAIHMQRAVLLRQTAEAAPVDGPLRARCWTSRFNTTEWPPTRDMIQPKLDR